MLAIIVSNEDEEAEALRKAAARGLRLSDVGTFNLPPGKLGNYILGSLTLGSLAYLSKGTLAATSHVTPFRTIPGPVQNDLRGSNIAVENAPTRTHMHPFGEFLSFDDAARRACLRSKAWINFSHSATGSCSLVM